MGHSIKACPMKGEGGDVKGESRVTARKEIIRDTIMRKEYGGGKYGFGKGGLNWQGKGKGTYGVAIDSQLHEHR